MLVYLYKKIPKSVRNRIGKTKSLKWLRDFVLRKNGVYKEKIVTLNKTYLEYNINFKFVASIKEASNAVVKGIENTMLSNSILLLRKNNANFDNIIIFDVGANFGYLSLVWAKTVCQKGKVISFEPNLDVFKTLSKSVKINEVEEIIKVANLAVGNENKSIQLYLNDSTSNVLKADASQISQTVDMVRLDDYVMENNITKCDLIKIDVDGIEMDILKGSVNVLRAFKPIFIVETNNNHDIIEFFIQNNYSVFNKNLEVYKPNDKLPPNVYCVSN